MKDLLKLFETVMDFKGLSFVVNEQSFIKKWHPVCFFAMVTSYFSRNVSLNNTTQNGHRYMISMIKLKSFEFSLKWRQEQISHLMRSIFMFLLCRNIETKRIESKICSWRHFKENLKFFILIMDIMYL